MSRSFKKNAILKDRGNGQQKLAHHRTRMVVRNLLNSGIDYDEMLFPTKRSIELIDPWDICDWRTILPTQQEFWYYFIGNWGTKLFKSKITDEDYRRYTRK
jgi:hypothetical protein